MGFAMHRRLKNFLPIVLFALAVQIFAPIGACWAASIAASDPLAQAVICHGNAAPGSAQSDQTGPHRAHDGCCSVCSVLHTGAPVDTPQTALILVFDRHGTPLSGTRSRRTLRVPTAALQRKRARHPPFPDLPNTRTTGAAVAVPVDPVHQAGRRAGVRKYPCFAIARSRAVSRAALLRPPPSWRPSLRPLKRRMRCLRSRLIRRSNRG